MHHDFDTLIDIEQLQDLFAAFHAATGIAASIISRDGTILVSAGWQKVCVDFHRKDLAAKRLCVESDMRMNTVLLDGAREAIYQCPHGLMDAAVPILIDDQHMANLFSGQFLLDTPDANLIAEFKQRAATYGFDERAYLEALADAPVIPEQRVPHILKYLKRLAEMIGELGLSQMRLKEREQALSDAQKRIQRATRRQAKETHRLTQTLEGSPMPTFVIDSDCRITHWNHACEMLTTIPATEIIGTNKHREAFYPQRRLLMADLIVKKASINDLAMLYGKNYRGSQLVDGGYEGEGFFPNLGRHGRWLSFTAAPIKDSKGRLLGAIETLQDITARRMAENEVRASEARYRHLFESANDAIFILKNGIILDCNQEALNLIGLTRNDLIGRSPLEFSPPTQASGASSKEVLMEKTAIAFQDVAQIFEWRLAKKSGAEIDVEVSLNRFKIGSDPHGLAIIRDITERNKMIRALEKRERELNEKTRYLEKVNEALKASLDHREVEKRSVEESMLTDLKRFVYPYLEDLGKCRLESDARAYVNIIGTHLKNLTSQMSKTLSTKYMAFTPTEIRVADYIRAGKNTKEIAALLGLSPSSVQWHRKNIREKLGLTRKKVNLYTFLASLTD